jgi:hypothetical protein
MSNITSIQLINGIPVGGTGNVSTIDNIGTIPLSLAVGANQIGNVSITALPTITVGAGLPTGANLIGNVSISSHPGLVTGANTIGQVTIGANTNSIGTVKVGAGINKYCNVAASQTTQALVGGGAGALGDYLEGLLIIPASLSPGAVTITDGALAALTIFAGGSNSLTSLIPFFVPIDAVSANGAWKVTTGASVSVFATGIFT